MCARIWNEREAGLKYEGWRQTGPFVHSVYNPGSVRHNMEGLLRRSSLVFIARCSVMAHLIANASHTLVMFVAIWGEAI